MAQKSPLTIQRLTQLFPQIAEIGSQDLRIAIVEIWAELWARSEFNHLQDMPVSLTVAYPQVKHTAAVVRLALAAADIIHEVHGTTVDRDVLIAGALLMDVSKLVEYRIGAEGIERTETGSRLPHGTAAAALALARGMPLDVVHIILAHSPNGGKAPATVEAHLLDWLDQLDLDAFGAHLWSRRVVHFQ